MNCVYFYLAFCSPSDTDVIPTACSCGIPSDYTECDANKFCWDDLTCTTLGKCTIQNVVPSGTACLCLDAAADESADLCPDTKYCINNYVCSKFKDSY